MARCRLTASICPSPQISAKMCVYAFECVGYATIPSNDKGRCIGEILILWSHSALTIFQIENYILGSRKYAMTTAHFTISVSWPLVSFCYSPGASSYAVALVHMNVLLCGCCECRRLECNGPVNSMHDEI